MRRRTYELCLCAAAYFIDPNILIAIWLSEMAWWYFGLSGKTLKTNGF
jgi:hypothetical protein